MRFINTRAENPNAVAGLFLLILLAVFAGPSALPRLISDQFTFVYEGVPCDWLRTGEDRAVHQSLIGRGVAFATDPPLSLTVTTNTLATAPDAELVVRITISNNTIGTVPFVLPNANGAILGPNTGENGIGIVFNNAGVGGGAGVNSYPETQIRLLGPRQRCVQTVILTGTQIDPVVRSGGGSVKAFYRNASRGAATPVGSRATIYPDQGLWIGVVESPPVNVAVSFP